MYQDLDYEYGYALYEDDEDAMFDAVGLEHVEPEEVDVMHLAGLDDRTDVFRFMELNGETVFLTHTGEGDGYE